MVIMEMKKKKNFRKWETVKIRLPKEIWYQISGEPPNTDWENLHQIIEDLKKEAEESLRKAKETELIVEFTFILYKKDGSSYKTEDSREAMMWLNEDKAWCTGGYVDHTPQRHDKRARIILEFKEK